MTYDPRFYFAKYAEIVADSFLVNNRVLAAGNNVFNTDNGAGDTFEQQILKQASIADGATALTTSSDSVQYADCTGGEADISLPVAADSLDKIFWLKKIDGSANTVVITPDGADTIDGVADYTLFLQYDFVLIQSNGVDGWSILSANRELNPDAPNDATYVVLSTNAQLENERVLTPGSNISLVDAGAGSTITVQTGTVAIITADPPLTSTSAMIQLCNAVGGAFAVTLPAASTVKTFKIKKTDSSANAVTVTRAGGDTIDGQTTYVLVAQYQSIEISSDGSTGWHIL